MNGSQSLIKTWVNSGVDVCFTNPGTSEMHFVVALDEVEGMRCVLGLFEGVVSGAADGYARMARNRPYPSSPTPVCPVLFHRRIAGSCNWPCPMKISLPV
jgi:hypothetical protein